MIEYIVSLRKGTDADQFHERMISDSGEKGIPKRSVEVVKLRPGSRNFHYLLTSYEASLLRYNNNVLAVETNPEQNSFLEHHNNSFQEGNFNKPDTKVWEPYINWGLMRCSNETNVYGNRETPEDNFVNYVLDGSGVDIVIMDSGVQPDHPEFRTEDGTSRVKTINWPEESGLTDIVQPATFYKDVDGHGTHVAGIAAGKTFGWAKNAHIYPMHINLGFDSTGVNIVDAFDMILNWHIRKTSGRPTVINMSWGVSAVVPRALLGGRYRGEEWSYTNKTRQDIETQYGILNYDDRTYRFNARVTSYDVAVDDLIDAGCHVITAAGNMPVKAALPNTQDYDNRAYFTNNGQTIPVATHQPGSPYSIDALNVGALGIDTFQRDDLGGAQLDTIWGRSTRGTAVNIFTPGQNIMSAYTSTPELYFRLSGQYPYNTKYSQAILTGTSMSAPQVAGMVARIAQIESTLTPVQVKDKLTSESVTNIIQDSADSEDYDNFKGALLGARNLIMLDKRAFRRISGEFKRVNYVKFRESSISE